MELFVLMTPDEHASGLKAFRKEFVRGGGSSSQTRIRAYATRGMAERARSLIGQPSVVVRFVLDNSGDAS